VSVCLSVCLSPLAQLLLPVSLHATRAARTKQPPASKLFPAVDVSIVDAHSHACNNLLSRAGAYCLNPRCDTLVTSDKVVYLSGSCHQTGTCRCTNHSKFFLVPNIANGYSG